MFVRKGEGIVGICKAIRSVFPTEGFLSPGTQVRQCGPKLRALNTFFV